MAITIQVNVYIIMLNEKSQSEKHSYCMLLIIYTSIKWK